MRAFCEYLTNPIGIDIANPRFSWSVNKLGGKQAAYRICVNRDDSSMSNAECLVWDSGFVHSRDMLNVPYAGEALVSAERYFYRITSVDEDGSAAVSEIASFTTGILEEDGWKSEYLGGPWMEVPAFLFRTSVSIGKPLKAAYLYVLSGNYNVVSVNGRRCSDAVLQNANTEMTKTALYATYPIENLLHEGENVIGISLGNGWKALNLGITGVGLGEHSFSCQMILRYTDGTSEWIYGKSDDWFYTKDGPVSLNSVYQGEQYDATKDRKGWDMPGYDLDAAEETWYQAVEFEPDGGEIRAQVLEPIRVVKEIKPVTVHAMPDGSYVFDMGQNFAGWARLRVRGERGSRVRLVYSELIHEDSTLNQISLRDMRATDEYILSGRGIEEYQPSFTFHGFRYVQVFGLTEAPGEETIVGCVVRSDVTQISSYSCDNSLLNQLQRNICWTEESNLHSIPTDCPQRNERLGWINDMTVRSECALYNYHLPALYTKWLRDIRDTQGKVTGAISDTAPFRMYGCRPSDPVGAALFIVPWNLYLHYGDKRILEECYDSAKRLLAYIKRNSTDSIVRWATMGDWAAPIFDNDISSIGGGAVSAVTPPRLVGTAFFCYENSLMAKMAAALGNGEDEAYYLAEAEKIKAAFLREYYHPDKKQVYSNSQGCNTIALYMDIIPQADRAAVMENIVADITAHDTHITTGNMCSRYIIELLLTNGYKDLALKLLTQTTYPSWGYMIENGATTIWERWEKIEEEGPQSIMASYNHPMYGAVGVCFYKYFAGIMPCENAPGFEKFTIKPIIPSELGESSARVETCRGLLSSHWHKEADGGLCMEITVPYNSAATVNVPIEDCDGIAVTMNGVTLFDGTAATREEKAKIQMTGYFSLNVESGSYTIHRSILA